MAINRTRLFGRWTLAGVFFVTRLKDNAVFTVETEFEVPQDRNIRADQIIQLSGVNGPARSVALRRVCLLRVPSESQHA